MATIALGIPTINQAELLQPLLERYSENWYGRHTYIIDNGNQKIDPVGSKQRIVKMSYNLGVAGSWNLLCRTIFGFGYSHIAILNDDIYWNKNADDIESYIEQNPADFYVGLGQWCCFVLPYETYEKVGMFDDKFVNAYFEDNDYEYRMKLLGLSVHKNEFFNPDEYKQSQSIRKDPSLNVNFESNKMRYIEKWGGFPREEKFIKPFEKIIAY